MKSFFKTIVMAICCCMTMVQFSSCLSDKENSNSSLLTAQEAAKYLQDTQGSFSGKQRLLYYTKNKMGFDSIAIDSVMQVPLVVNAADSLGRLRLSAKFIAKSISNNEKLAQALENMPDFSVNIKMVPYRAFENDVLYAYQFVPYQGLSFDVTYDDGTHHHVMFDFALSLTFAGGTFNALGVYSPKEKAIEFCLLPYRFTIDEKTTAYCTSTVLQYYGTK